jgi:hypothetical protein
VDPASADLVISAYDPRAGVPDRGPDQDRSRLVVRGAA